VPSFVGDAENELRLERHEVPRGASVRDFVNRLRFRPTTSEFARALKVPAKRRCARVSISSSRGFFRDGARAAAWAEILAVFVILPTEADVSRSRGCRPRA
jgi:phage portal protein BeeE